MAFPDVAPAAGLQLVPLHEFSAPVPGRPIQGTDGNFYGVLYGGLPTGFGSIYKLTPSGTETVLYRFGGSTDGANPAGALVQGPNGNFYGTTANGGIHGWGTIFVMTPKGALTTLHSFAATEGLRPSSELVLGKDGSFYGTAPYGGKNNNGTVFKITPAGAFTTLHSFAAYDDNSVVNSEGANPATALTVYKDGSLYGTTVNGGSDGFGTVFKITPAGTLTPLHAFAGDTDGAFARTALLLAADGNFYGATTEGGQDALGDFFKMTPAGAVTPICDFDETSNPVGAICEGADGNFYGTASTDTFGGPGSIYRVTPEGKLLLCYLIPDQGSTIGTTPMTGVTKGSDGNLYGVTSAGGTDEGSGVFFKIVPATNETSQGTATAVHSFTEAGEADTEISVTAAADGSLFGTVCSGPGSLGSIIRLTTAGAFTSLYEFDAYATPTPLTLASDGNFYGATGNDGANGDGTIYRFTPQGKYTLLHTFNDTNNAYPIPEGYDSTGPMVQGADGLLYGTCYRGGDELNGTVFSCSTAGDFKVRCTFSGSDAGYPVSPLAFDAKGQFYGASFLGGSGTGGDGGGNGAIYAQQSSGEVINIHSFIVDKNGYQPQAGLVRGANGNFYGTTSSTVFEITPQGVLTTLYTFTGGSDGTMPGAALFLAKDGNFYGTTQYGGITNIYSAEAGPTAYEGYGTIFKMTPAGELTTLYAFTNGSDGGSPQCSLVQGTDGSIYGAANSPIGAFGEPGEPYAGNGGVIFKLAGPPVITSATTATATRGVAFSYQIKASNGPTSFGAQGLADGLTVNAANGVISGTPTAAGKLTLTLDASNAAGEGTATLTLTIKAAPPVITSATTASATEGKSFSYQITASGSPTSYNCTGKPPGLSIDEQTGLLSGVPTVSGTKTLTLSATNAAGTATETLKLTIAPSAPVITSASTATATEGKAFSYQITATNSPASYAATGLPKGLAADTKTGLISGTPASTSAGTKTLTLKASNATGTGEKTLTLTISK